MKPRSVSELGIPEQLKRSLDLGDQRHLPVISRLGESLAKRDAAVDSYNRRGRPGAIMLTAGAILYAANNQFSSIGLLDELVAMSWVAAGLLLVACATFHAIRYIANPERS